MLEYYYVLMLFCVDKFGIVVVVIMELVDFGVNIVESDQFWDCVINQFFMCIVILVFEGVMLVSVQKVLDLVIVWFDMKVKLVDMVICLKVIIMVLKFDYVMLYLFYQI